MRKLLSTCLLGAAIAGLAAGCGTSKPAGPPSASALARKLGCTSTTPDASTQNSYDTSQYVDAAGGPCTVTSEGITITADVVIITFPSMAKETDWLHQNQIAESQTFGDGFFDLVVGHLWAAGEVDGAASPLDPLIARKLGGKDTSFG